MEETECWYVPMRLPQDRGRPTRIFSAAGEGPYSARCARVKSSESPRLRLCLKDDPLWGSAPSPPVRGRDLRRARSPIGNWHNPKNFLGRSEQRERMEGSDP